MLSITTSSLATKPTTIQIIIIIIIIMFILLLYWSSKPLTHTLFSIHMAKPKGSSKPKTSIFLCCFGSSHAMESSPTKGSYDPIISEMKKKKKKKSTSTSWFSWRRIRLLKKSSAYKTVPLEASTSVHNHVPYSKSKSTFHHKPQAPTTNPSLPQLAPVLPGTPYYTPTQVFIYFSLLCQLFFDIS